MSSQLNVPSSVPSADGFVDRGPDLPRDYGITRLVLMPRDPFWMHAYWEVAPYTWEQAERTFGPEARNGRAVLRFHAEEEFHSFDVAIRLDARSWYVFSPVRGGFWRAELGLILADGRFVLLAISNKIQLPSGRVSDRTDERWGTLRASQWEEIFELSGVRRLGGATSLDAAKGLAQRMELWRSMSSWPSGAPSSASSFSWGRPPEAQAAGGKKFWFVADCEIIVYGATEPDARVRLQGREVALNPDGTFSLRFALPDGHLHLPIEAVNRDGDLSQSIEITVARSTKKPE